MPLRDSTETAKMPRSKGISDFSLANRRQVVYRPVSAMPPNRRRELSRSNPMPQGEFTIKLGEQGKGVSVETLTQVLEDALKMLRNVSGEFVTTDTQVRWEVVRARMESPLTLTIAARVLGQAARTARAVGNKIVRATLAGVEKIESGAVRPTHFNEDALLAAKEMYLVAAKDGAQVTFATDGKRRITITTDLVRNVDEVVAKARVYVDHATIEGTLEALSVHGHESFSLWEAMAGNKVECYVTAELLKQAHALVLAKKRVAVTGLVRYRDHKPKSIEVESIRVLRGVDELPQSNAMRPIDITGDLSSEEHVWRMRNAR
jgi:hypothetical protein